MPIKTFRGQLADGESETIRLHTNNGLTGYKITKFQGISSQPGVAQEAHVLKLYSVDTDEVTTPNGTVDFDNPLLLGVVYFTNRDDELHNNENIIIFDNVTVNQDIFITHADIQSNVAGNYYLELEQVKLDLNEAAVATLKDMRGTN